MRARDVYAGEGGTKRMIPALMLLRGGCIESRDRLDHALLPTGGGTVKLILFGGGGNRRSGKEVRWKSIEYLGETENEAAKTRLVGRTGAVFKKGVNSGRRS